MFWKLFAFIVSRKVVADAIIKRAQKTPYTHLEGYMKRWWVFNPYSSGSHAVKYRWLPSVRIHHILREDYDRALHDHPWNARTIILRGWYNEAREPYGYYFQPRRLFTRATGSTCAIRFKEYHKITAVSNGGVWTLFITWKYRGTWGFFVDGVKIPYKEYLQLDNSIQIVKDTTQSSGD